MRTFLRFVSRLASRISENEQRRFWWLVVFFVWLTRLIQRSELILFSTSKRKKMLIGSKLLSAFVRVSMRFTLEIFFIAEHRDEKLQAIILKVSKIFRRQTFHSKASAEQNCAHTQFTWGDPTDINLDNNLLCSCFVSEVARRTWRGRNLRFVFSVSVSSSSSRNRPVS